MPVTTGTLLGRYRLVARAGAGGMSEVWKAEDETLHRTVAVKVILDPIAADADFTERFLREARLVAGLDHPNVLPVFDFGKAEVDGKDVSYLVMPLVAGGSLKERIRGPVPFGQAVAWLAGIAEALDHAHGKGILHRDVKPGNVLLDASGRPLLSDFGLARTADSASGLTRTGTVLGTPSYMAPEQATGQPLDGRADQYALAIIAFELLTGRVPFKADSPLAVLHQHVSVAPAPLTSMVSAIPKAADEVMHHALAKDPAARYASCAAFVAALGAALGVAPAAPAAPRERPAPPPLPAPAPEPSRAATVVTGAGMPAPAEAMAAAASRPPGRAGAGGGVARPMLLSAALVLGLVLVAGASWLLLRPAAKAPLLTGEVPAATPPSEAPSPETAASPGPALVAEGTGPAAAAASEAPEPGAAALPATVEPAAATSAAPAYAPPEAASPGTSEPASAAGPRSDRTDPARVARAREAVPDGAQRPAPEPPSAAPLPPREPLVAGSSLAADTSLSNAFAALDTTRKPGGRLGREDFASALGDAREVLSRRPSPEARFLDAYCRAAVAFASGDTQHAWLLLTRAFEADASGAADGRVLAFVRRQARALGGNPGPDAGWVLGLAFADVRGDLDEELERAGERAPDSAPVAYARALRAVESRQAGEGRRWARRACDGGMKDACDLLLPAPGRR